MLITEQFLRDNKACYYYPQTTDKGERLLPLLPLTPRQLMAVEWIPWNDKYWALVRLMTPEQQRLAARQTAQTVLHLWDAPEVVVRWLETGDEDIHEEALSAASAAVESAAALESERSAALESERSAAWAAARAAEWEVAREAAAWAAVDAAWAAARATTYAAWQSACERAIAILEVGK